MRVFLAVTPPPPVVGKLAALPRPAVPDVRWTTEAQWHVTLRFLGQVDDVDAVARALDGVVAEPPPTATLGPASAWFPGRRVLQVPVDGLEALAVVVDRATAPWGRHGADGPPWRGHLTLARLRGRGKGPASLDSLAGQEVAAEWPVPELALFSSTLGPGGSRYEVLHRVALGR